MIDPERITPKLSPLDWYKVGSSILFIALGGFILIRGLVRKGTVTELLLGGLILVYGGYRVWMAARTLRRLRARSGEQDVQ
jgi:hypothetical protein